MDEMTRIGRALLVAGAAVCLAAAAALAAGFQIPEQGMGPLSMGMGSVGLANDLSAVYHNPAGLTQLSGLNASVTLVGIMPSATYTRKSPTGAVIGSAEVKDDPIPVPAFAVSTRLGDRLTVAVGAYAPYGLSSEYSNDGVQRYMTTRIALSTAYIGPYAAWQATPQLSVGAGIQYVYGKAELGQHANYGGALLRNATTMAAAGDSTLLTALAGFEGDPAAANEDARLDGVIDVRDATDNAIAFNVGALYRLSDAFQVGAVFRKGVDLEVEGDVELAVPAAVTQFSNGVIQSLTTTGSTTVSLPDVIGVGLALRPTRELLLTSEINYHLWSAYEDIDFDFAVNDNTLPSPSAHYLPDAANPRDWRDTATLRLGAQYELQCRHRLRCGYLYDQSPMPNKSHGPELPMNNRNGLTFGYGLSAGHFTLDVAYAHLFIKDRSVYLEETIRGRDPVSGTITNPSVLPIGDYEAAGNIAGVGLSVSF